MMFRKHLIRTQFKSLTMKSNFLRFIYCCLVCTVFLALFSCQKEASTDTVTFQQLIPLKTIVSSETVALSNPSIIRYNPVVDEIYIYDSQQRVVYRIDSWGTQLGTIGRVGNGPGEFERISGIFIGTDCLYLVDDLQFLVHQFTLNGEFIESFDYGFHSTSVVNKVSVSRDGVVYIPDDTSQEYIIRSYTWDGREIDQFGIIPEGSTLQIDYAELRNAVKERRVPSFFERNAFVIPGISDQTIVYNATGNVHHYRDSELLWQSHDSSPARRDTIAKPYYEIMGQILQHADALQVLRVYEQGSAIDEFVYISTNTSFGQEMQLHVFDNNGDLLKVLVFESKSNLTGSFDINEKAGLVYVGNSDAEIIAYDLNVGH